MAAPALTAPNMAAPNLAAAIAAHSLLAAPAAPLSGVLAPARALVLSPAGSGGLGGVPPSPTRSNSLLSSALARLAASASVPPRVAADGQRNPDANPGVDPAVPSPGSPGTPPAVEAPVCTDLSSQAGARASDHEPAHPAVLPARAPHDDAIYPLPVPSARVSAVDGMHDTYGAHARAGGASPPAPAAANLLAATQLQRQASGPKPGIGSKTPAPRRSSFGAGGGCPPRSPRFAAAPPRVSFEALATLSEGGAAQPGPEPGCGPGAGAGAAAALAEERASYLSTTLRYLAHSRAQDAAAGQGVGRGAPGGPSAAGEPAPSARTPGAAKAAAAAAYEERAGEGAITRSKRVLAEAAAACPDHVYSSAGKVRTVFCFASAL